MTPLTIRHKTFNRDLYDANRNRHLRHLHYADLQTSNAVGVCGAVNSVKRRENPDSLFESAVLPSPRHAFAT